MKQCARFTPHERNFRGSKSTGLGSSTLSALSTCVLMSSERGKAVTRTRHIFATFHSSHTGTGLPPVRAEAPCLPGHVGCPLPGGDLPGLHGHTGPGQHCGVAARWAQQCRAEPGQARSHPLQGGQIRCLRPMFPGALRQLRARIRLHRIRLHPSSARPLPYPSTLLSSQAAEPFFECSLYCMGVYLVAPMAARYSGKASISVLGSQCALSGFICC